MCWGSANNKMNILVVTAYPPVLHRHGGGVRMYHNIRILSEKHRVHVRSFVGSDEEQDMLDSVRPICETVRGVRRIPDFRPHWLSVTPFFVREFSTPEMHREVDGTLSAQKVEVLQCEYLQMAQFRRDCVFSILTAHEAQSKNAHEAFAAESDPIEKLRLFYRWMQLLRYEIAQVRKFDRVVTMTKDDADYLKSYAPEAKVRDIPIGIDADEFLPAPSELADLNDLISGISVLFVGNFLHEPNVEAAEFLVKHVAPRFPEVRFVIAGAPTPTALGGGPNVEYPGYIPETRALYRASHTIVVAPLFSGTGQRVKLLEAFATACPVVTTRVGAMGFPIENGVQAFLAETPDEYESALSRLISDSRLRRRVGQNARQMILDRYTWNRIGGELLDVVAEAAVSH
jgi:glycosyltransferase involved in cell wall biosynthesis